MKKETSTINKIKTLLGLDVKLATMMLVDGTTTLEAEAFEAGYEVFIVGPEGNLPLPVGEYLLEDGSILVVVEEGIISEIIAMTPEVIEELPAIVEEATATVEEAIAEGDTATVEELSALLKKMTAKKTNTPKKVQFSKSVVDALLLLKKENKILKAKLSALEVNNNAKPSAKPISYNPENSKSVDIMKIADKRERNTTDRVFNKLFN